MSPHGDIIKVARHERNNWGCAISRAFREGALPNCRHLTLRCPEATPSKHTVNYTYSAAGRALSAIDPAGRVGQINEEL